MTERTAPRIVLLDFTAGRLATGHQEDYLPALEAALALRAPLTIAPFRTGGGDVHPATPHAPPHGRIGRYLAALKVMLAVLNSREPTLLVLHGPELRDFICFAMALGLRPRGRPTAGVFMMRREAWAMLGRRGWRATFLERTVRVLCRTGSFFMMSDSRAALEHWTERTSAEGELVTIPARAPPAPGNLEARAGPTISLLGGFRLERGARLYPAIIEACLRRPGVTVECHLGPVDAPDEEGDLTRQIAARWRNEPRVKLHFGHLSTEAFDRVLYQGDVVLLPYDAASYGPGTSGIMHEAVMAGRLVVSTAITWGVEQFGDDPHLIWIADNTLDSIMTGFDVAVVKLGGNPLPPTAAPRDDKFALTWDEALNNIETRWRDKRSGM